MDKLSADQFASEVLEAEGLSSENVPKFQRSIVALFVERFGAYEVSKETFVDRAR